ncbi:MAG: HEPN domain-containing protein [Planctomycetota bacterium]|jgi:HEPN domain-containing protein
MWFKSARNFFGAYESELQKRHNKEAAFLLHQAVERFYSTVTLVFVNYRFRTHDFQRFGTKAVSYNGEL